MSETSRFIYFSPNLSCTSSHIPETDVAYVDNDDIDLNLGATSKLNHDHDSYQNLLHTTENVYLIITNYNLSIAPL
jgi:hypothetical protein